MEELIKKIDSIKQFLAIKEFEPQDFIQKSQGVGSVIKIDAKRKKSLILKDRNHLKEMIANFEEIFKNEYLNENYSSNRVQSIVLDDIFNVLQESQTEYVAFKDLFGKTPQDCLVVRSIQGVQVSSTAEIGRYLFIYSQEDLEEKCKKIQNNFSKPALSTLCIGLKYPSIGVFVSAIDHERAREKAFVEFQKFENIVQFMVGQRWDEFYIRTVSSDMLYSNQDICVSPETASGNSSWEGLLSISYDINNPYFVNEVNKKIWDLFKKSSSSDWEMKLKRSINWIGKSLRNPDVNMAFLQMLFSLESLLVGDQKDFLSESITAKLADCVAYILANDSSKRIQIAKQMKKFYSTRSIIVHFGSENVSLSELNKLFRIAQGVIMSFFSIKELENVQSSDQLMEWFNQKRYS